MEENNSQGELLQIRKIELYGSLAQHPLIDQEAYALIVCHEIGHHLGGQPYALGYTSEGQSDYFSTAKCMKRFLEIWLEKTTDSPHQNYPKDSPKEIIELPFYLNAQCEKSFSSNKERKICQKNILAGFKVARWIDFQRNTNSSQIGLRDTPPPSLLRREPLIAELTLVHGYPSIQCRLDTYVAGALCPIDKTLPFSYTNDQSGACLKTDGYDIETRPSCWFIEN